MSDLILDVVENGIITSNELMPRELTSSDQSFAKTALDTAAEASPFKFEILYDPARDCVEYFIKSGSYYPERLTEGVVGYRDYVTGEIIGMCLKGVSGIVTPEGIQSMLESFPQNPPS